MKPPAEFMKFGLQFIQDIHLRGDTIDELMKNVLGSLSDDERTRLRPYLDGLLDGSVSDVELMAIWNATPADIYFFEASELRRMLRDARDRL